MANAGNLDGKDICTGISNINGVAIDSVSKISGNDKKSCATCTGISLAYNERSCAGACEGRECNDYYTDGTVGRLTLGNKIYQNNDCIECVADGFYSDLPCRGAQGVCFTVSSCTIIRIDTC